MFEKLTRREDIIDLEFQILKKFFYEGKITFSEFRMLVTTSVCYLKRMIFQGIP